MIKYLGSKRTLIPLIVQVVKELQPTGSVIDLFSGTSRVGHGLKSAGYQVFANDLNTYATTLATCYVAADAEDLAKPAQKIIDELNSLKGCPGYFTQTFCEEARFFQPKNGERVDAMRDWIAERSLDHELKAVLLTSLMEAADRVDSTCGLQMAFLKTWAKRSHQEISLRLPDLLPKATAGKGAAYNLDAAKAARTLSADVAYLDPPYNQHKYLGNYHIWETLVRWDRPDAYGIARKRVDVRQRKSPFNAKRLILDAMKDVVENLDVRHLVVSFSNEGHIKRDEMIALLSSRGDVMVIEKDFKRYVGAQIGIHSPQGKKVGAVSHLRNKEYVFVVPEKNSNYSTPSSLSEPAEAP
jgi:adenine-specific DNA-methyltransferase